ncbi:hypothetical protein [uncultured Abiotrophia sp.]|uniref:hypothetical protein n=1 Tax=uncultured Abiotrophia sp. TaxID=316094 RepID=UPI00288B5902|nr:hypothetical protein [uncultured Abiotrophia sp.]
MLFAVYKGKKYEVINDWPNQTQIISPTPDPGLELVEGGFGSKKLTMYQRICKDDELDNFYSEEIYLLYRGRYYNKVGYVKVINDIFYYMLISSDEVDRKENDFEVIDFRWYEKMVPESEIEGAKIIREPYPIEPFINQPSEEELIDKADLHQWMLDNPVSAEF